MLQTIKAKLENPSWALALLGITILLFTKELYGVSDFRIFYLAAEKFRLGENPYIYEYGAGFKYFYSPFFALLLTPFTHIDVQIIGWGWKAINILLLYKTLGLFQSVFNIEKTKPLFNVLFFGATLFLIYVNLHNHQMTILIVWGIFYALKEVKRGKYLLPGIMIATLINFKIIPIVLIPYFLYRKEFKTVMVIITVFIVLLFVPIVFTGWSDNWEYHASWWDIINPLNKEHSLDISERALCSISSFISVYFYDSSSFDHHYDFKRNIMNLRAEHVILIVNVLRLLFISSFLLVLKTIPFQKVENSKKGFFEIAYLLYITFMVFPHQQLYGMYLCVPLIFYCLYEFFALQFSSKKIWVVCFVIALLAINSSFIVGNFRFLYSYIKLNTMGALLLIPIVFKIRSVINQQNDECI